MGNVSRETSVSHEMEIAIPIVHAVREDDLAQWLEIGWLSDGAARIKGWHMVIWASQMPPVAPLSAVRSFAAVKAAEPWSKFFREMKWDEIPTFVYVIREDGGSLTKIGVAGDVKSRLAQHQAGNSRTLVVEAAWRLPDRQSAYDLERLLIRRFSEFVYRGREWFEISPAPVIAFVEATIRDNDLRGIARIDPKRAFNAPDEIFERVLLSREGT